MDFPNTLAIKVHAAFTKEYLEYLGKPDTQHSPDTYQRMFSVFMEDALANNECYSFYTPHGKKIFAGCLCYINSIVGAGLDVKGTDLKPIAAASNITKAFVNVVPVSKLATIIFSNIYTWDGSSMYYWDLDTELWEPCDEKLLHCRQTIEMTRLNCDIPMPDFENELVTEGAAMLTKYLRDLAHEICDINNCPSALEEIKQNSKRFNTKPHVIPCYSGPVNVSKSQHRIGYRNSDYFTIKLPFDPTKDLSKLTSNFVDNFQCPKDALASYFVRCGVSLTPTITIVCGPKGSGKSTLLKVARNMYGPYACEDTESACKFADYNLVRTCFVDNFSYLFDSALSDEHPCDHLVVTCEPKEYYKFAENTSGTFGKRRVTCLTLNKSIDKCVVNCDMASKMSARKQQGSLLGWALQNYDDNEFKKPKSSEQFGLIQAFMEYLASKSKKSSSSSSENDSSSKNKESSSSSSSSD